MLGDFYLTKDLDGIKTKNKALKEIAEFLSDVLKVDTKDVLSSILLRENATDTGLEKGIAIPHVVLDSLDKNDAHLAIITFANPVSDWFCVDGTLVRKAICLIVPLNPEPGDKSVIKITEIFKMLASPKITDDIQLMRESQDIVHILEKNLLEGGSCYES